MTRAREQIISLTDTTYYHCMARCVRRAYLCGEDSVTGKSFEHRKQWIVDKLAQLSEVFCIDICAYAVMGNHYHVVLKVNEGQGEEISGKEVLGRWCTLFKGDVFTQRYLAGGLLGESERYALDEMIQKYRERLIDISWFMRCLNESIARQANQEDGCRGRFWEGRFKSQALLDEAAVLSCMAYVDLNPIRAGMARSLDESEYTSIKARLDELSSRKAGRPKHKKADSAETADRQLLGFTPSTQTCESEQAMLPFSLKDYVELVDWTGRAVLDNKPGYIPDDIPPILSQYRIDPEKWLDYVPTMEQQFYCGIGRADKIKQYAVSIGKHWIQGLGKARKLFLAPETVTV